MKRVMLVGVLMAAGFAFAGDEPTAPDRPKSPAAVAAIKKHDLATEKAKQAYVDAMRAADRQLIDELDAAVKIAMKNGSLEEAKRIDVVEKEARSRLTPTSKNGARAFTISAKADWQPTIDVQQGQKVMIAAQGRWSVGVDEKGRHWHGPKGEAQAGGRQAGFLEAQIGESGTTIPAGEVLRFTADQSGELRLRMHDDGPRTDNEGQVSVTIQVAD